MLGVLALQTRTEMMMMTGRIRLQPGFRGPGEMKLRGWGTRASGPAAVARLSISYWASCWTSLPLQVVAAQPNPSLATADLPLPPTPPAGTAAVRLPCRRRPNHGRVAWDYPNTSPRKGRPDPT